MSWSQEMREFRHNPCLMKPVSAVVLLVICAVSFITLLFHIPEFILGVLLAPVLRKSYWLIEFLYPTGIARWGHFLLLKLSINTKSWSKTSGLIKSHSRAIEQRVEVVKGRVYIHSIPQLLDNIGYLVVCCPPPNDRDKTVVAFLVDCGSAYDVTCQLKAIRDHHYPSRKIELRAVLCTHKHHDHTAGNGELLADAEISKTLGNIYGGAVERVPFCNKEVSNGDLLDLPSSGSNDMNALIEVEVIAVPAHTRGSVVYALRPLGDENKSAFIFSGDTMFSGGSGMPFEADTQSSRDADLSSKRGNSFVRASAGSNAIERCFAEILVRSLPLDSDVIGDSAVRHILVFPGHEYTADLMNRQFASPVQLEDSCQWGKLSPAEFFEVASRLYCSLHLRTLPKNGKLLTVPSSLSRELIINPHFRNMRKRGQQVINALQMWHNHFSKDKIVNEREEDFEIVENGGSTWKIRRTYSGKASPAGAPSLASQSDTAAQKTASTSKSWNLSTEDVSRPVFTTLYASDFESVISDLQSLKISPKKAAQRLSKLKGKMESLTIRRRPIPGTLPTGKNIYMGALGLALLGSPPNALTISDSRAMKLPAPTDNSDHLRLSKKRLVAVLSALGLIPNSPRGRDLVSMIDLLWKEAQPFKITTAGKKNNSSFEDPEANETREDSSELDEAELGVVRWALYGVQLNQPSWFSKMCMPCGSKAEQSQIEFPPHPAQASGMRRTQGELVRHDVSSCPICLDSVGCPDADERKSESAADVAVDDSFLRTTANPRTDDALKFREEDEDFGDDGGVEMEVLPSLNRGRRQAS